MYKSREDVQLEPGSWSLWRTGRRALIFCCPFCRQPKIIRQDVLRDGRIAGQVRCIEPGCKFQDDVTLVGWKQGEEYP